MNRDSIFTFKAKIFAHVYDSFKANTYNNVSWLYNF